MSDSAVPHFDNPQLKNAVEAATGPIKQYKCYNDVVGADIRALDKYLNEQGIKLTVQMDCNGREDATKNHPEIVYELIWADWGTGFRLRCRVRPKDKTDDKWLVLADAPVDLRALFYPYLPAFVDKLVRRLKEASTPAPLIEKPKHMSLPGALLEREKSSKLISNAPAPIRPIHGQDEDLRRPLGRGAGVFS